MSNFSKLANSLFVIISLVTLCYFAQGILFPIILGLILAVLLMPVVNFFSNKLKFPQILAISVVLILFLSLLFLLFIGFSSEIHSVFKNIPEITHNLNIHYQNFQIWFNQTFKSDFMEQSTILKNAIPIEDVISGIASHSNFGDITGILMNVILVPIYTFLILLYKGNLVKFLHQINSQKPVEKTDLVISEINQVLRSYIVGLLIEMLFVAIMTSLGLWIIGIKYFLFLGILTAFLNLIPYIGILVSCGISILLTIVGNTNLGLIGGVILVNIIVQVIDNNFLIPKIVGSKVRINALASMIGIILGGAIAGIGGTFLALPILAVLKVIFANSENNKAFATLIGESTEN